MIRRDMPEVLEIERQSFAAPWAEQDFLRCIGQRNCIGMVAEQGEEVVGFMVYQLHHGKLHLMDLAVHPAHRRWGIGAQMVAKLVSKLSLSHRRKRITLIVAETNLGAQLFFRAQGFRALRVLRGHLNDGAEDAYLMRYRLG